MNTLLFNINHKTMNKLTIRTLLLATIAVSVAACGNKKKQKEEIEVKKQEIAQVVTNYVYPLPSSIEIAEMLNEIEASYILGISNAPENISNYTTEVKKALNLGIYLSDLSYASVYKRKQAAEDYLSTCESLIRQLHVDDSFQSDLATEIKEQMDNRDSLVSLMTTATQNVYSDLHQKGQKELAYLMVTGAWTETMYLTLIISENTPLNKQIVSTIIFQHKSLLETIKLLEEMHGESTVRPILAALKGIKSTFDQEDPNSLTKKQFNQLTAKVSALRNQIVE